MAQFIFITFLRIIYSGQLQNSVVKYLHNDAELQTVTVQQWLI